MDNQQPSLEIGRFNDYLVREYTQVGGSTVLPVKGRRYSLLYMETYR